jgi:acetyl-CoA acetyltransferase
MDADVDPLSAMSLCVRLAVGATQEFRRRAAALDDSAPVDSTEVIAYMASTKQTAQIAKMAIDAGLAEREALIAERAAELIAAAFEESIAEVVLPPHQRARIVARFVARLAGLEGRHRRRRDETIPER